MATYLVTGAAGFIASKVAEFLLDDGHSVVGIDNLNDAYDVRLKDWRLARLTNRPGFYFQQLDITDVAGLSALWARPEMAGCQAVINLAARAGVRPSVEDPRAYYDTNLNGTLNLLDQCRQHGVAKFVLASTSSLYGGHNTMPYSEDDDSSRPLSPYAASKKAAETLCYSYHYLHGIDVTVFRYFTVYGPAGRPDMSLFRFVQWIAEGKPVQIFGDGTQSRDFTYVDDIARGTIAGLKPLGYEVINLGSDQPLVLIDTVRQIEALVGREAQLEFRPRHPADVNASWANIEKAGRQLGWEPRVTTEQGIRNLVAWYMAERDWAKELATG